MEKGTRTMYENAFVKVMGTIRNADNEAVDHQEELIRIDDLIKVVKWGGEMGTEVCFEWYDKTINRKRQWIYDCGTTGIRDGLFDRYELMLCGERI